jgi:hypothetical protein
VRDLWSRGASIALPGGLSLISFRRSRVGMLKRSADECQIADRRTLQLLQKAHRTLIVGDGGIVGRSPCHLEMRRQIDFQRRLYTN